MNESRTATNGSLAEFPPNGLVAASDEMVEQLTCPTEFPVMEYRTFTATDAALAIWNRKRLVLTVFGLTLVVVGLFTVMTPKTYLSDAQIFVRLGRENSALDVTAGLGEAQVYALPMNRDAEINSIAEMMTNKELFGRVVDRIGPERILKRSMADAAPGDPVASDDDSTSVVDSMIGMLQWMGILNSLDAREKAIIKMKKKTRVDITEKSNVIRVSFETYTPELAQEVVRTIVNEYTIQHSRTHRPQGGTSFLTEQTKLAEKTLRDIEDQFESFKSQTGLISIDDQRKVYVDRVARIENQLMETEATKRATEAEIAALETLLGSLSQSQAVQTTEGAGNEGIDGMRQELFRLQVRREELLAKYSPDSPLVQQVEAQLKATQQIFDAAEAQLVEKVEGPNKVYSETKLSIILKQPQLNALETKAAALNRQLKGVKAELKQFNSDVTDFVRLEREVEIHDLNFKRYKRNLQQATMDQSMQENNLSNLSVFQTASFNPKPYRPRKLVNLIAGFLLGIFSGCGLVVLLAYRQFYMGNSTVSETTEEEPAVPKVVSAEHHTPVATG